MPSSRIAVEFSPRLPVTLSSMNAATRLRQLMLPLYLVGALLLAPAARADDVDLLLVLAADVSRSIDAAKFQLQRDGYAAAVADPRVLDTIRAGRNGRIPRIAG